MPPEMKGPVKSVLWIHNAILRQTKMFEDSVAGLSGPSPADPAGLFEEFKFFRKVLEFHEGSEDRDFFPVLDEKFGHVTETYDFDHRRQQAPYADIEAALQALAGAPTESRRGLIEPLQRQAVAFGTAMELHVAKENELLYPLYDSLFSPEEQMAMNQKAMQEHAPEPELMAQVLPWMFRLQTPDEREGLARFFLGMFPPAGRPGLVQMLSSGISAAEWSDLTRRVPELVG